MPWDARIRRRLKLRDLDTLMAVAQWGSMAKAATHLRVSQPAISKAIADMEHTLGVRLLDRLAQGIEPTLYGRALLKSAAAVFDDVRQGINEIEFLGDSTAGEVRIGATEPMIAGLLPAVLDRLHRQYPRIAFHVTQITLVMAQVREVRERNVDLTLGRLVRPLDDDMNAEELFDEHVFVVAGTNCPWTRRRKIELAELMNEPWAIPPRETFIGSLFADAFQAQGLGFPQTRVIADPLSALLCPAGNRTLSRNSAGFHAAIQRQAPRCQNLARRLPYSTLAGRDRYFEKAHAQSGGAPVHRLRSRGRKAVGQSNRRLGTKEAS